MKKLPLLLLLASLLFLIPPLPLSHATPAPVGLSFEAPTVRLKRVMDGFAVGLRVFYKAVRVGLGVLAEAV